MQGSLPLRPKRGRGRAKIRDTRSITGTADFMNRFSEYQQNIPNLKAPDGYDHTAFIYRALTRNIIARWNFKAKKTTHMEALRMLWYRGFDPSHNFNRLSLQTLFNRAMLNAAERHRAEGKNPCEPAPLHVAYLAAIKEARQTPFYFNARDNYIALWNDAQPGDFVLLNDAEEKVWCEFLRRVWRLRNPGKWEKFPYEPENAKGPGGFTKGGMRLSMRVERGLDLPAEGQSEWFRFAVEEVLEDGDVVF